MWGIGGVAVLSASAFCLVIDLFGRQGNESDALRLDRRWFSRGIPDRPAEGVGGIRTVGFRGCPLFSNWAKRPE